MPVTNENTIYEEMKSRLDLMEVGENCIMSFISCIPLLLFPSPELPDHLILALLLLMMTAERLFLFDAGELRYIARFFF
jgi:hypothetical protein